MPYQYNCLICGKPFQNNKRTSKYCSQPCYALARRRDFIPRFLSRFEQGPDETCWEWSGTLTSQGYGTIGYRTTNKQKQAFAHRISYEYFVGPIPEGLIVLHTCDNPRCVNPNHLSVGSFADNSADMAQKGRSARGEKNANSRLTPDDVRNIRASNETLKVLAGQYGVSAATISCIRRRLTWKHL